MVFVFDYDGVIYDREGIRSKGIEALQEAISLAGIIYIVTGRWRKEEKTIRRVLVEAGVSHNKVKRIITRRRGSEIAHKLEAYTSIIDYEGCIGEIHDDNPEVLWPARRLVTRGLILHHNNECEPIHGYTLLDSCREP